MAAEVRLVGCRPSRFDHHVRQSVTRHVRYQVSRRQRLKRLIFSGFDRYTLDGGTRGTAPGSVGNNIRHGNPSGATVLATDGTKHVTPDGTTVFIEAYVLPVNYPEFEQGYLEDTVGPFMLPGPRQVNASVTVSQAGPDQFNSRCGTVVTTAQPSAMTTSRTVRQRRSNAAA